MKVERMQPPESNQLPKKKSLDYNRLPLIRLLLAIVIIIIIAVGTIIWIYLGPAADLIYAAFVGFGTLLTFLQVFPSLFSTHKSEASIIVQLPEIQPTSHSPSIVNQKPTIRELEGDDQRQLFTALDIGTALAKALIVELKDDKLTILGVGRHQQGLSDMSDGIVTDIKSVISNCNEALIQAEQAAGGIIAPTAVIGIAGELVKGSSTTVSKRRKNPKKPITPEELEELIDVAQQELSTRAKHLIVAESGMPNIQIRLINSAVIATRLDGQNVFNPIGFQCDDVTLTVFSAFAPLMQTGALETVAQGLDLTLMTIVAEPYALARCLSSSSRHYSGGIFIDIGGGTTDIALVREGGLEGTRMFAFGGRKFTHRIADNLDILSLKEAELLKINYSNGLIKGAQRDDIRDILAPACQTWMDGVELLIDDLSKGEVLPSVIFTVGGSSVLPDLHRKLLNFPWTKRLPFVDHPVIKNIQPNMVPLISDPNRFLVSAQDITPMALAYQAVELQYVNNALEKALWRVIDKANL